MAFASGMSAALRVPLRAFKIDPATVIGKTSKPSTSGSSFLLASKSPLQLSPSSGAINASSWGRSVSSQGSTLAASRRSFSAKASSLLSMETKSQHKSENAPSMSASQRSVIKWFLIGSILGLGAVTFSDQAEHAFQAAKRSGRVVGTLAVCINE